MLTGAKELLPRWKRCGAADRRRDSARRSARPTSTTAFPPEAKARMLEMVHNLEAALHDRIERGRG